MRVTRNAESLLLELNPFELEVVLRLLRTIAQNYKILPDE